MTQLLHGYTIDSIRSKLDSFYMLVQIHVVDPKCFIWAAVCH